MCKGWSEEHGGQRADFPAAAALEKPDYGRGGGLHPKNTSLQNDFFRVF